MAEENNHRTAKQQTTVWLAAIVTPLATVTGVGLHDIRRFFIISPFAASGYDDPQ